MSLTCEEYENLLEFSTFINKDYESYIRNVGYGLKLFFHFPLTVYTVLDSDSTNKAYIDQIVGHDIYSHGLKLYQEQTWKSDLFMQRVDHYRQGKMQDPVITIPDIATYDEFYATEYGQYLKSINTPYQATLRANHDRSWPMHVLCVFKTTEQGEFTEHERELLSKIGQVFRESVKRYLEYVSSRFLKGFLEDEAVAARHNLAIVDELGDAVFSSKSFQELSSDCPGVHNESSFLSAVKQAASDQLGVDFFSIVSPVTVQLRSYEVSITKRTYTWGQQLRRYFFVLIQDPDSPAPAAPAKSRPEAMPDLVNEYGFTLRELEIAKLLTTGMNNNQLAESLHISLPTVKFHVHNIHQKLGVTSRSAAIAKLMNGRNS